MRAIYCRGLAGTPIRWAHLGQWSHGGIVMPDRSVVNARPRLGVVREPWDEFIGRYSHWHEVEKYTPSDAEAYAMAQRMVGERWGYGYGEVLNFISRKLVGDLAERTRVECIEAIEICLQAGGRLGELARFEPWVSPERITPQQSYITR